MQNFSNSPAPPSLPPGFSARGGGGPLYPPQPAEPQISPRMTDDYAGLQQQAQNLHRGHAHPGQASHMLAYSARNRGAVEAAPTQAGIHAGSSNNPYRKDVMDYYFSMGAKDRHRRGGMGFAAGFGYPNMDGHLPHQYRHAGSSSAASSGMMSYPAEYSAGAAAAGAVAGAGAFSPSQFNMSQSPVMQTVPGAQMQHRQHGQTFPAVHHTPQQRSYPPHSGHRMTPQYPHYSPQSAASTGSSGMYSPPPQRYLDGAAGAGFDPKVNSSPSVSSNSVSSSAAANNVGQMESVQQGYHAANYPGYPPQTHHKQAALQHRNSQHGLGVGYDSALKLQSSIQGPLASSAYVKHHQASASSLPQAAAQEIAKSPMHPAAQQPQINQNFSPISNPSPAASAVHSPSCSSSPSPLMGVAEAHVTPSGHAPSHPNPRSSHAQGRLLQTMPQLSPTPNSNSSISSCGSSGSHKAHSMSAAGGGGLPRSNKMGPSTGVGPREDGVYSASPLDKMQDSSLNSLSALSSQVANLPNTVQHMLLTDSVLAQKRGKDGGGQHGVPPRSRNASAASSTSTVKDGAAGVGDGAEEESSFGAKVEREEGFSEGEHGRVRQMSGASSGSEPAGYQMGQNVKTITSDSSKELKAAETKASSPVTTSVIAPAQPNCVSEPGLTHGDHRGGQGKLVEIKHEVIKSEGAAGKTDKGCSQDGEVKAQNGQAKDNRPHVGSRLHNNEEKLTSEEQQSAGGVGVIVSTHAEKRRPQDNCVDEKPPHSYFREASSHNGDEGMDLSLYSSHRQKSNFGQTQNPPHKYSHPESTYGSDLSTRNRGRAGAESNSRYLGYQQSQAGFVQQKEASSAAAEALVKRGSKGHEENSQLQQFPSLLQEVLQGYNLDRRYGRPEQAFPAHLQVQQYPSRHPYEAVRMQSGAGDGSTGKLPHPNQRHGNETDFPTEPQPLVKSEASSSKIMLNAEKAEAGASQSRLPQAAEAQPTPTKHINLADYSLPQRKALPGLSSSAVQELLLQEPEPLSEAHKSSTATVLAPSERRSVICDVSPNRRSTPERDREGEREKSQSGASVIQQPFSSPAAANDLSKKETGEKQVVKMEAGSSKEASGESDHHGSGGANEADVEYHAKAAHSSGVINADPYRRGGGGGADVPHMPANPLSSPPRHQSFLHGVDLSASSSTTFPSYRYGESREGGIIPRGAPHFPPHHPYHSLSPQTQSPNKLQMFRGPHHPHDMSDWVKAMSRTSKDVMVQPGSSPGRPKAGQSEQRPRMIPQSDVSGEHAGKASLHHQSPFFDLKMWEQSGREGVRIMEGDPFYRTTQAPPSAPASHGQADPESVSRAVEEAKHPLPPPPPPLSSTKPLPEVNSAPPKMQRPAKAGGSGDTNPLMLRRRVRSFISPIPAKRQLQERAATNSHHSPAAQTESSHHTEDDAAGSDVPCPRLSSPLLGESSFSQPVSPAGGGAKVLPPRKGRGLKLEAIVQKITPNIKKPTGHADEESNHYPGFSHPEVPPFNDSQDQDVTHFPRAAGDDSFMDEGHALNDMLPFRGVDDAGPLSSFTCDPHQTPKQQDFDFGLGSAASGSGDKEDFALLGPLPPPPPLPRPVQGSPPPSSSALSDIQHFTNTYQQLETRRGEQSAANLLRQKLQETGIGFDDYPAGDYYGATSPHPGHILSRQMSSGRSSLSPQDTKPPESVVPKGYFPSGKKKGRPVGSVNKQKRTPNTAQTQAPPQNATISAPPAPLTPTPAAATPPPTVPTITTPTPAAVPPIIEPQVVPPLAPPVLTQVVKVDVESEDTQPEAEVKPARRRRKGVKDEDDPLGARGRQRRRRRGAAAAAVTAAVKESLLGDGGSLGASRVLVDPNRKGPFVPHIHVEKKVPEIGAVCTIVNAEEDKTKGGAAGGKGIESLLTSALKETEKREADEVEATLQSGKALPSSGFLVSGPVITETNHSGRLLCCLCQKWANYKHLGDLYGPFYPAEYAAKLPKNQPQVRQCITNTASNKTGPSSDVSSNSLSSFQDSQTPDAAFKAFSESYDPMGLDSNPSSFASAFRTATLVGRDEMIHTWSTDSSAKTLSWDLNPPDIRPIPELKREPDLDVPKQPDEAQQRPQHRKLTSHPRFKRRHKSSEDSPRMVPSNSKASLPFQPPPPALDSLGPLAQLAQLPQMPMDPEELWVHEGCIVWTSGVYLVNGRLYGLQEALDGARETSCSYCDMVGSTLGCYSKGCTLRYHYLCAMEADCSLNEDNFSLRCPKHKFTQSIRPAKSVYLEQSERG